MRSHVSDDVADRDRWAEALTWYGRLRQPQAVRLSFARRRQWQIWCADPENRRIFGQASRLLDDRSGYAERRRPRKEELAQDPYDLSVPIAEWQRRRPWRPATMQSAATSWRWWLPLTITAAVAVLCVLGIRSYRSFATPPAAVVYQTQVGGLEDIRLGDGSRMILGGRTKVSVVFSAGHRRVRVIAGQAWFNVADNPRCPFVVTAGAGRITDLGTAFLVTRESDRIVVTVTQGAVEVAERASANPLCGLGERRDSRPPLVPIRVNHGEELAFADDGVPGLVRTADVRSATAWIRGQLTFDDQPLRYVVETVDRYTSRPVSVGPAAGALRFSGIVRDDRINDWLQSLQVILPVVLRTHGANVRIQMRQTSSPSMSH